MRGSVPPRPTKDGTMVQGSTAVRDTTPAGVATKHSERNIALPTTTGRAFFCTYVIGFRYTNSR